MALQRSDIASLLDMLSYCRPDGSATEVAFVARFIEPVAGSTKDPYGNWHVTIGDSPILWSCHVDTVHRLSGRQTMHHDPRTGIIALSRKSHRTSSCLGADDTAGVWLCLQLIAADVPGHYIFHAGEEIGGTGSSDLATHMPDLIVDSQYAIALDRKGTSDVITHQFSRCASDVFAQSLASQLNLNGLTYAPSDRGLFTDTANYTGVIGECTNLSIGYAHCHTKHETLDTNHLAALLDALRVFDPTQLVASRTPRDVEFTPMDGCLIPSTSFIADRVRRRYGETSLVLFSRECLHCAIYFDPYTSTAEDCERFCSADCEHAEWTARTLRTSRSVSVYLDPDFQAVQDALFRKDRDR